MKLPTLSLKRTLDITMNDTFRRIKSLESKDSQALIEEYKEWIDAYEEGNVQPHVLYLNQIISND